MSVLTIASVLTVFICGVASANGTISIHIAGDKNISSVRAIIEGNSTFVALEDVSAGLGIVSEEIGEGMIGLCKGDLCFPLELDSKENTRRDSGVVMVSVNMLAGILQSTAEWIVLGRVLRFVPNDWVMLDDVMKIGDVIPDFVLPSIADGKMVPFSSFRGKRVLLFLWASW